MNEDMNLPEPLGLTAAQREALQPHLKRFRDYAQTEQFGRDQEYRHSQLKFFQRDLRERLTDLAESDVVEMVSRLWAAQIWGNKLYLAQKIVSANGLDKLKMELTVLWADNLSVAERYDRFRENVSYLGPAAVTEIMCYIEPHRCGIWNQKARQALKILGFQSIVDPNKYQINGTEYETFNRLCAAIAEEVEKLGFQYLDLLTVDYFLYEVARAQPTGRREGRGVERVVTGSHSEIQDTIAAIGALLGFDVELEQPIAHGARVDVVWRVRIGNLGLVTYVFEVQKGGNVDSLILNLQKAESNPTVQKVVAVSDKEQLEQIEKETEALPSEFRSALAFWSIEEVQQVSENLQAAMALINKLGLAPGRS